MVYKKVSKDIIQQRVQLSKTNFSNGFCKNRNIHYQVSINFVSIIIKHYVHIK